MAKLKNIMPYLRKAFYVLAIALVIAGLFSLGAMHRADHCERLDIEINAPIDKQLLTIARVQDLLEEWYPGGLVGLQAKEIDLASVEGRIAAHPAVKEAQVSYSLNGVLHMELDLREPIVRISGGWGGVVEDYYMDVDGERIPAMSMDPARVPIASGVGSEQMSKKVYTLARYVHENEFAKALVEQIFVSNEGDLLFIPKIGTHRVVLGDAEDLDSKFYRLRRFYEDGLSKMGWDRYRTINLKYAGQIVCN